MWWAATTACMPSAASTRTSTPPARSYVPLAFAGSHHLPRPGEKPGASAPNRFYMYGVIGRLAMLAASYELEATDPDAEVYE
jgi:glutamate--cysteine ligase